MPIELKKYEFVESVSSSPFLEEEIPYYTDSYRLQTAYLPLTGVGN